MTTKELNQLFPDGWWNSQEGRTAWEHSEEGIEVAKQRVIDADIAYAKFEAQQAADKAWALKHPILSPIKRGWEIAKPILIFVMACAYVAMLLSTSLHMDRDPNDPRPDCVRFCE
ncbi:MAG: hypothetical protein M3461_11015 [Pseudomonadota bacterium]|nr:hypothetical protein [Pseudomonadota bacterium]